MFKGEALHRVRGMRNENIERDAIEHKVITHPHRFRPSNGEFELRPFFPTRSLPPPAFLFFGPKLNQNSKVMFGYS